jgi:hypothetical protein
LEDPQIWSGVLARFIVYLCDQLQPMLRPRYIASVDERVFVEGPDRQGERIKIHPNCGDALD